MRYKATQKQIKAARKLFLFDSSMLCPASSWCGDDGGDDDGVRCLSFDPSPDKAMVLKHHPDKRKAAGEQIVKGDNDYFTCITKGWSSSCSARAAYRAGQRVR